MQMNIRGAARILRVVPRTVARAIKNEPNGHFDPDQTHVSTDELGLVFDCLPSVFDLAYQGNPDHVLLTPKEAIEYLKIPERTFRHRQRQGIIKPVLRHKKTVRYTREYLDTLEL